VPMSDDQAAHESVQAAIYVGGITGSGKTTTCGRIAGVLGARCKVIHIGAIACNLGAASGLAHNSIEAMRTCALDELQGLVVSHICAMKAGGPAATIFILDGHFTLANDREGLYRLPKWFFQRLGLTGLILCVPPISDIATRIRADSHRTRPPGIVRALEFYAAAEERCARHIAESCNLPLKVIQSADQIQDAGYSSDDAIAELFPFRVIAANAVVK
jgi:adenylate kinase